MDEAAAILPPCAGCSDGPGFHAHKGQLYCDDCAEFMRICTFAAPANDDDEYLGPTGYDKARDDWEADQ